MGKRIRSYTSSRCRSFFARDIHTRDIPAIAARCLFPGMRSLQECFLQRIQEIARATDGSEEVLGLNGQVIFSQTCYFLLNERAISRVDCRQCVPIVFEMLAHACA